MGGALNRRAVASGLGCGLTSLAGSFDALGLMIKADSFGDYFALLCHESTCLSEKGKRLGVSSVFTFRHSGSALSVRASLLFLSTPIGVDRSSPTGVRKAQSQVRRIQPGFSLSSRVARSMRTSAPSCAGRIGPVIPEGEHDLGQS